MKEEWGSRSLRPWTVLRQYMPGSAAAETPELAELIAQLDQDRAWLLEQIDRGRWSDLRLDLAALERELGQLLAKASERLDPTT
jgi:hypothetical protein